jgi:hypothetical protein
MVNKFLENELVKVVYGFFKGQVGSVVSADNGNSTTLYQIKLQHENSGPAFYIVVPEDRIRPFLS